IVIALSVLALGALTNLFLIFNSIYGYQQISMATAGSSAAAMNAFEAAVLPAEEVLASHDFSGTTYSSEATTLVLQLPAVDSSGNIIPNAKDYVAFYTSSTNLYRLVQASAGSMRVSGRTQLSTTLSSLSFTYDDSDFTNVTNIIADIQTQAQFKEETVQSNLHEQLYLRNKQPLL
ncbi:MAG: hypothetical protein Q8O94_01555, partial [bacterium]|nr:hypothetical protein [bacterium]